MLVQKAHGPVQYGHVMGAGVAVVAGLQPHRLGCRTRLPQCPEVAPYLAGRAFGVEGGGDHQQRGADVGRVVEGELRA